MVKKLNINISIDDKERSITITKNHKKKFGFLVIDLNNMNNITHCYEKHLNIKNHCNL